MAYGITANGFEIKALDDIKTDLEARMRAVFGNDIDVSPASTFGQFIGVQADALADTWQLSQALYAAQDPNNAEAAQLDALSAQLGVIRKPATSSRVTVRITATANGATIPAFVIVATSTGRKAMCLNSTSIPVAFSGQFVDIPADALETGPLTFGAGTLTAFDTPVSNLTCTNPAQQDSLGTAEESDASLRIRRVQALSALSPSSVDGLRSKLLQVTGVTDCVVFQNESDATDSAGIPPHCVECVVDGGDSATIRLTILANKCAGIGTHGNQVSDTSFSRPVAIPVQMQVTVRVNSQFSAANGQALIKQAIEDLADSTLRPGTEVRSSQFIPAILSVPGVLESELPLIKRTSGGSFSSATLNIYAREKASIASADVNVTVLAAVSP